MVSGEFPFAIGKYQRQSSKPFNLSDFNSMKLSAAAWALHQLPPLLTQLSAMWHILPFSTDRDMADCRCTGGGARRTSESLLSSLCMS